MRRLAIGADRVAARGRLEKSHQVAGDRLDLVSAHRARGHHTVQHPILRQPPHLDHPLDDLPPATQSQATIDLDHWRHAQVDARSQPAIEGQLELAKPLAG